MKTTHKGMEDIIMVKHIGNVGFSKAVIALLGLVALPFLTSPAHGIPMVSKTNSTFAEVDAGSTTRTVAILAGDLPSGVDILDVDITIDFAKCNDEVTADPGGGCPDLGGPSANEFIVYRLSSPEGTTVNLVNQATYSGQVTVPASRVTVTFDDAAVSTVGGTVLTTGSFRPVGSLANFNGEKPVGTWSLFIQNAGPGDPLGFYSFTLDVIATPEPGTILLLGTGLVGLIGYGWRKRKQEGVATTTT